MIINTYEAAATLIVGVDAFRNERRNVSSKPRVIRAIAIVGGNAINEAAVDLYIEDYYVGRFRNSLNGAVSVIMDQHIVPIGPHYVPVGSKLSAVIAIAPTVSPLIIQLF